MSKIIEENKLGKKQEVDLKDDVNKIRNDIRNKMNDIVDENTMEEVDFKDAINKIRNDIRNKTDDIVDENAIEEKKYSKDFMRLFDEIAINLGSAIKEIVILPDTTKDKID